MQDELQAQHPLLRITIGGINQTGLESGNAGMVADRDLTWLQDADANQNANGEVWDSWQAVWRDVFVLDGANANVRIYNLTTYGLATPANYAELKGILIDTAMVTQKPFTYANNPVDVDANGIVAPLDALLIINKLNQGGSGALAAPTGTSVSAYVDVDGNLIVAPKDALTVINVLNHPAGSGEGEAVDSLSADKVWSGIPTIPIVTLTIDAQRNSPSVTAVPQTRPSTSENIQPFAAMVISSEVVSAPSAPLPLRWSAAVADLALAEWLDELGRPSL